MTDGYSSDVAAALYRDDFTKMLADFQKAADADRTMDRGFFTKRPSVYEITAPEGRSVVILLWCGINWYRFNPEPAFFADWIKAHAPVHKFVRIGLYGENDIECEDTFTAFDAFFRVKHSVALELDPGLRPHGSRTLSLSRAGTRFNRRSYAF